MQESGPSLEPADGKTSPAAVWSSTPHTRFFLALFTPPCERKFLSAQPWRCLQILLSECSPYCNSPPLLTGIVFLNVVSPYLSLILFSVWQKLAPGPASGSGQNPQQEGWPPTRPWWAAQTRTKAGFLYGNHWATLTRKDRKCFCF